MGSQTEFQFCGNGWEREAPPLAPCQKAGTTLAPTIPKTHPYMWQYNWDCRCFHLGRTFQVTCPWHVICKRSYIILPFWLLVYETMFAKREDWQGLERSELLKYFNDCGHFPTQNQIDEYWDLFHRRECCISHSSPAFLCPLLAFVLVPSLSVLFYLSFSRV